MEQFKKIIIAIIIVSAVLIIYGAIYGPVEKTEFELFAKEEAVTPIEDVVEQAFLDNDLKTNTAKTSIDLQKVLDGGPQKDGIPALTKPKFISIQKAIDVEDLDRNGVVVSYEQTARFYPYSILVHHEIINDEIDGIPVLVTFCPLCGSAIVYDPTSTGRKQTFGVSGKLYESNLLMYDKKTESLWSQSLGTAVVGEKTGTKLTLLPSHVMTFAEFIQKYPHGEVLSRDTGYERDYDFYPYGDYHETNQLYFPVSIQDTRLPSKELVYVVPFGNSSVAFHKAHLVESKNATVSFAEETLYATYQDGEVLVRNSSGAVLPGYHEMWFSWATHHQENGVLWVNN